MMPYTPTKIFNKLHSMKLQVFAFEGGTFINCTEAAIGARRGADGVRVAQH